MKKQWKVFLTGFIVTIALFSFVGVAYATVGSKTEQLYYKDIKVTLDGDVINLVDVNGNPAEPFIMNDTTYLPVRAVSSALGLNVEWDGTTHTVILTSPEKSKPVYITRTGSKWHYDSTCNGGTYWEVPYSTATGMGLTPCDKCVHN